MLQLSVALTYFRPITPPDSLQLMMLPLFVTRSRSPRSKRDFILSQSYRIVFLFLLVRRFPELQNRVSLSIGASFPRVTESCFSFYWCVVSQSYRIVFLFLLVCRFPELQNRVSLSIGASFPRATESCFSFYWCIVSQSYRIVFLFLLVRRFPELQNRVSLSIGASFPRVTESCFSFYWCVVSQSYRIVFLFLSCFSFYWCVVSQSYRIVFLFLLVRRFPELQNRVSLSIGASFPEPFDRRAVMCATSHGLRC